MQFHEELRAIAPFVSEEGCKSIIDGRIDPRLVLCPPSGHHLPDLDLKAAVALCDKRRKLSEGIVLNHRAFSMSALDREIVAGIPLGGNWKDIPPETVRKSKRLTNIVKAGGRTTYYGRLDPDKPSYTIMTYFNRPGSGTNVHPVNDRCITPREAARLQSFKDDYLFTGGQGKVLRQIGNAVPPLLAMQIASKIREETGFTKTIGLFSGAGGFATGFREAGMASSLETDFDIDACITLKANNPEIPVMCADITKEESKDAIVARAIQSGAEVICGGPPCQGFSMAGKRSIDDPRNQLFKHYAEVVRRVMPRMFVFENVEGLLSMSKGQAYKEVMELFGGFGYRMEGRLLNAADYGVPQRRKRVIVFGVRDDVPVDPSDLYPSPSSPFEGSRTTVAEALSDLYGVECGDEARYDESAPMTLYQKEMRSMEPYGKHVRTESGEVPIDFGMSSITRIDCDAINPPHPI